MADKIPESFMREFEAVKKRLKDLESGQPVRISDAMSHSAVQGAGYSSRGKNINELENTYKEHETGVRRAEHQITQATARGDTQAYDRYSQMADNRAKMAAAAQTAINYQRQEEKDPNSIQVRANRLREQVQYDQTEKKRVQEEKVPSYNKAKDASEKSFEKFSKTLDDFNKAVEESSKNLGELSKEAIELGKEVTKLETEYNRSTQTLGKASSGSDGGFATGAGRVLSFAGSAMRTAGDAYGAMTDVSRFNNVQSEQRQTNVRLGMADLAANQQQDFISAGMGGNTAALRRIRGGVFGSAMAEGNRMGELEQGYAKRDVTASGLRAGGAIAEGVGEGMVSGYAKGGAIKEDILSGAGGPLSKIPGLKTIVGSATAVPENIGAAIGGTVGGIEAASATLPDYLKKSVAVDKGLPGGEVAVERANQMKHVDDTVNRIGDQFSQMFRDQIGSATEATRGAGSGRNAAFKTLTDPGALSRIAEQGFLSPEQAAGLTKSGVQGLGAGFRGESDIVRAGQIQRGGSMSAEQYMQARSGLASGGGGAKELEELMAKAVASGMNNSKNIQELVHSSSMMASRTAVATATNTAGAAIDIMSRATQSFSNLDPNLRAQVAQSGLDAAKNLQQSKDMSPASVLAFSELRQAFPQLSSTKVDTLSTIDAATIKQMQMAAKSGDRKQFEKIARTTGASEMFFDQNGGMNQDALKKLSDVSFNKTIRGAAGGGFDAFNTESLRKKMLANPDFLDQLQKKSYTDLSPEERELESTAARLNLRQGAQVVAGANARRSNVSAAVGEISTGGGAADQGEFVTGGAAAQAGAKFVGQGASDMGGVEGFSKAMQQLTQSINPEKMAAAAKEAYESMKMPATTINATLTTFNKSIDSLDVVVNKFRDAISSLSGSNAPDMLNKMKNMNNNGNLMKNFTPGKMQ